MSGSRVQGSNGELAKGGEPVAVKQMPKRTPEGDPVAGSGGGLDVQGVQAMLAEAAAAALGEGPTVPRERLERLTRLVDQMASRLAQSEAQEREQARLVEQAREAERRLVAAQRMAGMGDVSWDVQSGTVTWSEALYNMLGYDPSTPVDFDLIDGNVHHPEDRDRVARWLADCVESGAERLTPNEYRLVTKDGRVLHCRAVGDIERSEDGRVVVSASIQNITEQKRHEEALQAANEELERRVGERTGEISERAQEAELLNRAMVNLLEDLQVANRQLEATTAELDAANRELEAFSYSVSHDLRAPLRAVDGFSRALQEDFGDRLDGEGLEFLKCLREASGQMGQLIDDLLRLSRMTREPMQVGPVDLGAVAESVVADLRAGDPAHQVEFSLAGDLDVEGDAQLLQVALANLLGNAWKFTRDCETPRVCLASQAQEGERVYSVSDNGAGFDMDYADKLFGPFQRLHRADEFEGSGIGLATAQRIVARHRGRIWGEGAVGRGATFCFTLGTVQA